MSTPKTCLLQSLHLASIIYSPSFSSWHGVYLLSSSEVSKHDGRFQNDALPSSLACLSSGLALSLEILSKAL